MADPELISILKQGSEVWNHWRMQHPGTWPGPRGADLSGANLTGANLHSAYLYFTNLSNADLRFANLSNANFSCASLRAASLLKADLRGANLYGADLSRADLSDSDLRGAYLCQADLDNTDLGDADLLKANLNRATLTDTSLNRATLSDADLSFANLSNADLSHANLSAANLSYANLSAANLSHANLSRADLRGATLLSTIFADVSLSEVKGLTELNHRGPSQITLHTLKLPQDGSALHFLRGAGVTDEWIDFYRATMMKPTQYHSCFISYSSKDETFARRLHNDLQAQGVRCWFAPEDMKTGDKIRARIDEAIHLQDKLLLLLSQHALDSNWIEVEVEAALEKQQRQGREVLFPVRLDESVMQTTQAWAKQLRRGRHIGNFINWTNPQAYEQAFERLLRDLKTQK